MEPEYFEIPAETVQSIRRTRKEGGRIFCVGTTACKALEDSRSELFESGSTGDIAKASSLLYVAVFF